MSERDEEGIAPGQSVEPDLPGQAPPADVGAGTTPVSEAGQYSGTAGREPASLFNLHESQEFQERWDTIQTGFVDQPRRAVEQADSLVADVIKRLAETFAEERRELEEQWGRGSEVSTEDLRLALQRYRSFFARLLSIERPT